MYRVSRPSPATPGFFPRQPLGDAVQQGTAGLAVETVATVGFFRHDVCD